MEGSETPESYRRAARAGPAIAAALDLHAYLSHTASPPRKKRHGDCSSPDPNHEKNLARLEDHNITNQFSAMGSMKPGLFRRWTTSFLLRAVNYTTRHIYDRGHLSRVPTIHFARWVFLDDKKRLFFASNYDGSLDSYMDDFINKVGWG